MTNARQLAQHLAAQLSVSEKIGLLSTTQKAVPRLGLREFHIGGEAAHGIVDRETYHTTSFPIPLTLSQTFDPALLKRVGTVVSAEARALYNTTGRKSRLMPWAPTVDLERDPRWGRNEEGYGEDPFLTGAVAGGYIDGLQGDAKTLRVAAAPKHFFANNTEAKRGSESNSVTPRMKHEYYLKVFKFAFRDHHAQSMMTGYNGVNGIPMMQSPELAHTVKGQWGMDGTIVTDGSALTLNIEDYKYFGDYPHAVADALHKGMDCFVDDPGKVEEAAKQALIRGLITEAELTTAITNTLTVRARLGQLDESTDPYAGLGNADIGTQAADDLVQEVTAAGTVLLKNETATLPLTDADRVLLTGPAADRFVRDWYATLPMNRETLRDGLQKRLGARVTYVDSNDHATLAVQAEVPATATPDLTQLTYEIERWQGDLVFLRDTDSGRYLQFDEAGQLCLHKTEVYDWVVREAFVLTADGALYAVDHDFRASDRNAMEAGGRGPRVGTVSITENGAERVAAAAGDCTKIVIAGGNHPLVIARETEDRTDLELPAAQRALFDRVAELGKPVVGVLITGYSFVVDTLPAQALLEVGYAGQSLGAALAKVLVGDVAPTGKLSQTWYNHTWQMPSMREYDIEKTRRTYQFAAPATVQYPFGFGLTYGEVALQNASVDQQGQHLTIDLVLENREDHPVTETPQVYLVATALQDLPNRQQLIAFEKTTVAAHSTQLVTLTADLADYRWYDAKAQGFYFPRGTYQLAVGFASGQPQQTLPVTIDGAAPATYDLDAFPLRAGAFDDATGAELTSAGGQYEVVSLSKEGSLTYRHLTAENGDLVVTVLASGRGQLTLTRGDGQHETQAFDAATCEQPLVFALGGMTDQILQVTTNAAVSVLTLTAAPAGSK
ncbi:beta-glucosidase family protein [Lacticaseibacillus mingshuiensis]|uniref:Beta-glucosidase n=1 Tax=Lacticaseibacillus mingshuiensis TaxID=2799574 RepID=A0ABW4CM04_9LACO|nr:glycoside hydrolase family 3 protein [Lacticaseibacillus mingshuiensis]